MGSECKTAPETEPACSENSSGCCNKSGSSTSNKQLFFSNCLYSVVWESKKQKVSPGELLHSHACAAAAGPRGTDALGDSPLRLGWSVLISGSISLSLFKHIFLPYPPADFCACRCVGLGLRSAGNKCLIGLKSAGLQASL